MPKGKYRWVNRLPAPLPIWIGLLIVAALLIRTGEQLQVLGGAVLAVLIIAAVLSDFIDR
jgi:hypothetical protein